MIEIRQVVVLQNLDSAVAKGDVFVIDEITELKITARRVPSNVNHRTQSFLDKTKPTKDDT